MPVYAFEDRTPRLPEAGRFWIAPTACIVGDVLLGDDVGIWFGAVARGDNERIEIHEGCNIQEGVMLHADPGCPLTIGAYSTVGHHAILHGCSIGTNCLVGMGATILNNAQLGANCVVGANALVTQGKIFPPHSLIVGSPAKVVRTLGPDSAAEVRQAALGYIDKWRSFSQSLREVCR